MINSVDSDETALREPSHMDLHCLHRYWFLVCRVERVKAICRCMIDPSIYKIAHVKVLPNLPPDGGVLTEILPGIIV